MLLGHEPEAAGDQAQGIAGLLAPDVDVQVAVRFLARHGYAGDAEGDAEAAATAFVTFAAERQRNAAATSDHVSKRLR